VTKDEKERILNAIKEANKVTESKIQMVEAWLDSFGERVSREVISEVLESLTAFKDMPNTPRRIGLMSKDIRARLDAVMARVAVLIVEFVEFLLEIVEDVARYFGIFGVKAKATKEAVKLSVRALIGVDRKFVQGGYIENLVQMQPVREQVLNFARLAAASKMEYSAYQNGVRNLLQSNGIVQDYFRQYAYDAYNNVREVANAQYAEALSLRYFIYEGSVIDTTREFCRKKAGKVFSTDEAKTWKNDPDLIEPSTRATYLPLIERGRYNCRHFINYISDELAFALRPDLNNAVQ
jgi:hypothetical protein